MAVQPRFMEQRSVQRGAYANRFPLQRLHRLGATTTTLPTLASISPTTTGADETSTTITCTGTNFVSGITRVTVNKVDQPTTYVSATSVTFAFKGPTSAGTRAINVHNGEKPSTTPKTLTITEPE